MLALEAFGRKTFEGLGLALVRAKELVYHVWDFASGRGFVQSRHVG